VVGSRVATEYGDVFQLQFGQQTAIVLNSMSVVQEALSKWDFAGRPRAHPAG
jgi:hypothetical protein